MYQEQIRSRTRGHRRVASIQLIAKHARKEDFFQMMQLKNKILEIPSDTHSRNSLIYAVYVAKLAYCNLTDPKIIFKEIRKKFHY